MGVYGHSQIQVWRYQRGNTVKDRYIQQQWKKHKKTKWSTIHYYKTLATVRIKCH